MNHRERLLAVFEKRPVDRLPWMADLGYWLDAAAISGRLPEAKQETGKQDVYRKLDLCLYYNFGSGGPAVCRSEGVTTSSEQHGDLRTDRISVDGHVLEMRRRWLPQSYCYAVVKHYITGVEQLALLREIVARRRYAPNPRANTLWEQFDGDGLPIVPMVRSPLPALLADWIGVEGTIWMMADAPAEMEKTLQAIDRSNDGFFELLSASASPLCHFCDNLSSDIIGGYWNDWCDEYYRRRVAQVHALGKYCVTHLDGATRALIPRLAATGVDGIEALTPLPVGDIAIEEMARLMEPFACVFWGGLPGVMFTPSWSWADIKGLVDRLFQLHRGGRRVIAGSTDQVPPDGDLERVRQVGAYLAELSS